jgi:hypothetical protein
MDPALSSGTLLATVARRQTRPTLVPALFVGKGALAHQVPREIPSVVGQLYSYCEYHKFLGHKSPLSRYIRDHAAVSR